MDKSFSLFQAPSTNSKWQYLPAPTCYLSHLLRALFTANGIDINQSMNLPSDYLRCWLIFAVEILRTWAPGGFLKRLGILHPHRRICSLRIGFSPNYMSSPSSLPGRNYMLISPNYYNQNSSSRNKVLCCQRLHALGITVPRAEIVVGSWLFALQTS